jgi:hypothetical protein
LYQLEFGVTTLVNVLTRFGAGSGLINNGKIIETGFTTIVGYMDKFLTSKNCLNALLTLDPGTFISGCFSPAQILDAFGWKGLFLAPLLTVGSLVEFFHSELNVIGDQFNDRDKYQILIRRFDFAALAPYVGDWYWQELGHDDLIIKADGTGTEGLRCEGSLHVPTALVCWNATLQLTVASGEVVGMYTSVSCQNGCNLGDTYPGIAASFKLALGDHDTLIRTWIGKPPMYGTGTDTFCGPDTPQPWSGELCNAPAS